MIDFTEKEGNGRIAMWDESEDIDDQLYSSYGEPVSCYLSTYVGIDQKLT